MHSLFFHVVDRAILHLHADTQASMNGSMGNFPIEYYSNLFECAILRFRKHLYKCQNIVFTQARNIDLRSR